MKKNYAVIAIFLLLGLNLWRWWPEDSIRVGGESDKVDDEKEISLQLVSTLYAQPHSSAYERNIFQYKKQGLVIKKDKNKQVKDGNDITSLNKSSARIKKQSVKPKLRLAGVLIKENARHAFILSNGKKNALSEGDVFDGRYKVKAINGMSVRLYNLIDKHDFVLNL